MIISVARTPWFCAGPLLALMTVVLVACSDSERDRLKATTQVSYDPATGRLSRLTADLNKDGIIDAYTYMDGTRVLRSEIDADQDGKIEKWEFHGADGKIERVAVSREKNGKADSWLYPGPDGSIARAELSSEQDPAKIDGWEWYENGVRVRSEEDASGDGKVDKWTLFGPGESVRSVALDENYDGTPDRRLTYGEDGRLLSIESEPDGRGGYKKRIAVR